MGILYVTKRSKNNQHYSQLQVFNERCYNCFLKLLSSSIYPVFFDANRLIVCCVCVVHTVYSTSVFISNRFFFSLNYIPYSRHFFLFKQRIFAWTFLLHVSCFIAYITHSLYSIHSTGAWAKGSTVHTARMHDHKHSYYIIFEAFNIPYEKHNNLSIFQYPICLCGMCVMYMAFQSTNSGTCVRVCLYLFCIAFKQKGGKREIENGKEWKPQRLVGSREKQMMSKK